MYCLVVTGKGNDMLLVNTQKQIKCSLFSKERDLAAPKVVITSVEKLNCI